MEYHIHTPDGQKYTADSIQTIQHNIAQAALPSGCMIWHEGLDEWKPIQDVIPPVIPTKNEPTAADKTAKILKKTGKGLAKFASKSYKKATLKNRFSKALSSMLEDGVLDQYELEALQQMVKEAGANWNDVVVECQPIAAQFIRHLLADAIVDEEVTEEEEKNIQFYLDLFNLDDMRDEVDVCVSRVQLCFYFRKNILPQPLEETPPWLNSGEIVYRKSFAAHINKKTGMSSPGELWITSNRVEFVSNDKSVSLKLKSLRGAEGYHYLDIQTNRSSGSVMIETSYPDVEAECIKCLMRLQNRTASTPIADDSIAERRKIPQEVRQAVWIRDGGMCCECGAEDYLEFDHVIPVSKGGGNSVKNIQLLCRRCNGKKSNKI